jgi:hypothetical protein
MKEKYLGGNVDAYEFLSFFLPGIWGCTESEVNFADKF